MNKNVISILLALSLAGCSAAGHHASTSKTGGLKTNCAGGCAEYKSDGSGCAIFVDETAKSCAAYFKSACEASPISCKND